MKKERYIDFGILFLVLGKFCSAYFVFVYCVDPGKLKNFAQIVDFENRFFCFPFLVLNSSQFSMFFPIVWLTLAVLNSLQLLSFLIVWFPLAQKSALLENPLICTKMHVVCKFGGLCSSALFGDQQKLALNDCISISSSHYVCLIFVLPVVFNKTLEQSSFFVLVY